MIWDWSVKHHDLPMEPNVSVSCNGHKYTSVSKCKEGRDGYVDYWKRNSEGHLVEIEHVIGNVEVLVFVK